MASSWVWPKILVWTVLVFFSFAGYGMGLSGGRHRENLGLSAAIGMASLALLGGLLVLASLASPALNIAVVLAGVALFVWKKRDFFYWGAFKAYKTEILLLLSGCVASAYFWLYHIRFNIYDDFHAYLNFPLQILQTGTLRDLSFNDRALMSLGGNSYLQSLFLAVGGPASQYQLEAVSAAILACLVWHMTRTERFSLRVAVSVMPVFMAYPTVNSSALVSGAALFLAALICLFNRSDQDWRSFVTEAGLLISALVILKSSFIFPAALLLVGYSMLCVVDSERYSPRGVFARVSGIGLLGGLAISPWLVLSRLNFGTFMYPFFGVGYRLKVPGSTHLDGFGVLNIPFREIFDTIKTQAPFMLLPVLILILLAKFLLMRRITADGGLNEHSKARVGLLLLSAALINQVALLSAVGEDAARYSFPFTIAVIFFVLFSHLELRPRRGKSLVLSSALIFIFFGSLDISNYPRILANRFSRQSLLRQYRSVSGLTAYFEQAQAQIPPGVPIFVSADCPFLLDFSRNRVYLCDTGATISLPPGMPVDGSPKSMREYFRRLGIRYVLYSKNEANFSREVMGARLSSPYLHIRTYAERLFALFDALKGLRTSALIFENDYVVLLDVDMRSGGKGPSRKDN